MQQIAKDLAGYTLAEADLLRRAMGKKIKAEMDAQRGRFLNGATERGIDRDTAVTIFDACAKFAEYGFNKSHSAPYAFITYQTAWMKANHPVEFMAASLTLETGNTDKIAEFRREAIRLGIAVEPPSVNRSGVEFDVAEGRILYSLAAIKGSAPRRSSTWSRCEASGRFAISPISASASIRGSSTSGRSRASSPPARSTSCRPTAPASTPVSTASSAMPRASRTAPRAARPTCSAPRWPPSRSSCPRSSRGSRRRSSSASTTPSASISPPIRSTSMPAVLQKMRVQTWAEFTESVRRGATAGRLAGTVTARQERRMRTGNRMAAVQLSDPTGSYEGVLFSEGLTEYRDLLEPGRSVVVLVSAEDRPEGINVRIQSVEPLDKFMAGLKQIRVFLRDDAPLPSLEKHLGQKGEGAVSFILMLEEGQREVEVQPARPLHGHAADRERAPRGEGRGAGGDGVMAAAFAVFDLARFAGADQAARRALGVEVDGICRETGFLAISGHGVPQETIDAVWSKARTFFDLPLEAKLAAKAPYPGYPYGYLPPQAEALAKSRDVETPPDLKESFNGGPLAAPPGLNDPEALGFCYAPTIWPSEPAGFVEAWQAYYSAMEVAGRVG